MTPEKYALLRSLKVGDVIAYGRSRTLRVVRQVSWHRKTGRGVPKNHPYEKGMFYFTIKKCSWTGRCYTVYSSVDLATIPIEVVSRRYVSKMPAFDQAFLNEIGVVKLMNRPLMDCCSVRGIG